MPKSSAETPPAPQPVAPARNPFEAADMDWERPVALAERLGQHVLRFEEKERDLLRRAYLYAEHLHRDQKRASGEPYFSHLLATTRRVLELGLDAEAAAAALLHDSIEDTPAGVADLRALFPDPIADLVDGVTKISSLNFYSERQEQAANLRKMIMAMAHDIRVVLIKLADRLHNMETLQYLPPHKQRRIARTTLDIYAPLAGRLGIYRIKSQLEDLSMYYLYPAEYRALSSKVAAKKADRETHIERSIEVLSAEIAKHGIEASISGRSKHFYSIFQKMRNQQLSFEEIYDLNALRVICKTRNECYIILGIIHAMWKPVPEHFSDYIAMPKPNLYQSIHTKVMGLDGQLTEVQVRTEDMHRVAEEGIAAHFLYKGDRKMGSFEKQLVWLRHLVEWIQDADDPGAVLSDLKSDNMEQKLFCFTPRGDVIELPRGATVLDFAYRIHTELGHRCIGAKVNQRFVPLRTRLRMGDLVDISTSKAPHPSPDWLQIVTTSRARSKIRHELKARDFEKHAATGREMIVKYLSQAGIHVSPQELTDVIELHLDQYQGKNVEDVLADVGFGNLPTAQVASRFIPQNAPKTTRRKKAKPRDPMAVLVDGKPGDLVRFAQCCKPQPGDPILGFITRGRGVSIHHAHCTHLHHWTNSSPENASRIVPVNWASEDYQSHEVGLRVSFEDRTGMLAEVLRVIAAEDIPITNSQSRVNPRTHRASAHLTLMVRDEIQVGDLINALRELPGVENVAQDSKHRRGNVH